MQKLREAFHRTAPIYDRALLTFHGTEGWDVYNCSIPFAWEGKTYIFGRVERREEWANSTVWLFEQTGKDEYTRVNEALTYPLEDPYVSIIDGEFIVGGTHVRYSGGKTEGYRAYFYRGTDPRALRPFTCGPRNMKDIRLVQMQDGRIGVFSRARGEHLEAIYGTSAVVGFTIIDSLDQLDADTIENAPVIPGVFGPGEWGGCNQCYLLKDGRIGVIGHRSYHQMDAEGINQQVYLNISFIFDPATHAISDMKIIGDRPSYPMADYKTPNLQDCAFTGGIVLRADGKADLYSGLSDAAEGRITIDVPFGELLS